MAVVAPSTHVMLLQNVPLDKTYRDTMTFANKTAQYMYFSSKVAYTADACQFVRTEGAIRFPEDAEKIDTCNYLMFQNEGFGNKWYYAFIDRVEYAQTGMSRIWFTLDVMQTWAFDYTVHPCMVVREHVTDDSVGANLVSENVPLGPYVGTPEKNISGGSVTSPVNDGYVGIIAVTEHIVPGSDPPPEILQVGGSYYGIYQAVDYLVFDLIYDVDAVNEFIDRYTQAGKASAIVAMYACPANFLPPGAPKSGLERIPNSITLSGSFTKRNLGKAPEDINGYKPRNNKLFTYPYCFIQLTGRNGSASIYRYELFKNGDATFEDQTSFFQPVEHRVVPRNYAVSSTTQQGESGDNVVVASGSPVLAWSFDSYANYMGANRYSIAWGLMQNAVIGPAAMAFSGSPVAGAISSASTIFSTMSRLSDMEVVPPTLKGNLSVSSLTSLFERLQIYWKTTTITAEFAKIIDDYFTMYGYQVNRLKVPNIKTRPSWNYVETQKAMITGSIPFGDLDIIRDNFNRGITFWHGDWVGDYTRNNGEQGYTPPVGPVDPPVEPSTESVTWGAPFVDWQSHVTSEYGWRTNPITGEGQQFHSGIDIAYPTGTQIMAIASGAVIRETSSSGRGMYMDVKVNDEYTYRYQHLSAYDVPNNSAVTLGEYIAKVGATGDVTGPHLHLEILKNGQTVDPRPYLEGAYNG